MSNKRILFYVHFNKKNSVEDYVLYQLEKMKPLFDKVVLLSNSKVSDKDKSKFDGLYDDFIQRENSGYDFAAWRDGMNAVGWPELVEYDEVTIMNDTCFGPIYDFEPIYDEMQNSGVDFWGMTLNLAMKNLIMDKDLNYISTPVHIQSYYITFTNKVIRSEVFKKFWTGVEDFTDVNEVIIKYEVVLTELLASHGFTYDAYYNAVKDWGKTEVSRLDADTNSFAAGDMEKYNPGYTCTRPLWLLNTTKNYPFIKTKAIFMASAQYDDIRKFITSNTNYPVGYIEKYVGVRYSELIKSKDELIKDIQKSKSYRVSRMLATHYNRVVRRRK